MKLSSLPLSNDVLDVIHIANHSLDRHLIRQKVLNVFLKGFYNNGAIFFLPDNAAMFSDIMIHNLDEAFNGYFKSYYNKFDPLHLMRPSADESSVAHARARRISYRSMLSTEYYNDFLRPQRIHYKLVVPLTAMEGIQGRVVLTRSTRSPNFTRQEVEMAQIISPYLAHALSLNDLRRKLSLNTNLLNHIENNLSTGILLFDEDMQLVHMNQMAAQLCRKANGAARGCREDQRVPPRLMAAFRKLILQKNGSSEAEFAPARKTLTATGSMNLSVDVKVIQNSPMPGCKNHYMVNISEIQAGLSIPHDAIRRSYGLTQRELDVMGQIFKGLKNAEIAEALYISEITVKKHIQKIYAKVGVKNRTSMMNKIMALPSKPSL